MKFTLIFLVILAFVAIFLTHTVETRQAVYFKPDIRSDVVVTKFGTETQSGEDEEISTEPGWMVRRKHRLWIPYFYYFIKKKDDNLVNCLCIYSSLQRRTLIKFGKVASTVGNSLGRHSVKVTSAIEKICEIIKTIVPVISAICGVGQFEFCSSTNGVSDDLNVALKPNPNDLDIPD